MWVQERTLGERSASLASPGVVSGGRGPSIAVLGWSSHHPGAFPGPSSPSFALFSAGGSGFLWFSKPALSNRTSLQGTYCGCRSHQPLEEPGLL